MAESVTPLVCPLKVTGLLPSNADQIRNWKSDAPLSITISINKYSYGINKLQELVECIIISEYLDRKERNDK